MPNCTLRTLYIIFNQKKVQWCYQWRHQFVWPISTLQKSWENPTTARILPFTENSRSTYVTFKKQNIALLQTLFSHPGGLGIKIGGVLETSVPSKVTLFSLTKIMEICLWMVDIWVYQYCGIPFTYFDRLPFGEIDKYYIAMKIKLFIYLLNEKVNSIILNKTGSSCSCCYVML